MNNDGMIGSRTFNCCYSQEMQLIAEFVHDFWHDASLNSSFLWDRVKDEETFASSEIKK